MGDAFMALVFLNGRFINREDAKVDIEDRGYQFGDGIYEVIRIYNGKMFTVKEHLQRLIESAEKIKLTITYSIEELEEVLGNLVRENQLKLGIVYIQVTRGVSARNHLFPSDEKTTIVAYTKELNRPFESIKQGVKVKLVEDIRWLKCEIKSLNLLPNIMARQSASEEGCYEAIFHRGSAITEGSASNICIVKNGVVLTHPANNLILNGISRQVVLKKCMEQNIDVDETTFTIDELFDADEAFLTSTTSEVMPILEVEGRKIGKGLVGNISKKLQAAFEAEINVQCMAHV